MALQYAKTNEVLSFNVYLDEFNHKYIKLDTGFIALGDNAVIPQDVIPQDIILHIAEQSSPTTKARMKLLNKYTNKYIKTKQPKSNYETLMNFVFNKPDTYYGEFIFLSQKYEECLHVFIRGLFVSLHVKKFNKKSTKQPILKSRYINEHFPGYPIQIIKQEGLEVFAIPEMYEKMKLILDSTTLVMDNRSARLRSSKSWICKNIVPSGNPAWVEYFNIYNMNIGQNSHLLKIDFMTFDRNAPFYN